MMKNKFKTSSAGILKVFFLLRDFQELQIFDEMILFSTATKFQNTLK